MAIQLKAPIKEGKTKVGDWILVAVGSTRRLRLAEVLRINALPISGMFSFETEEIDPNQILEIRRGN